MVRHLTDAPGAVVDRHTLISALGNANPAYNLTDEQRIAHLAKRYVESCQRDFKVLSIDKGILKPTLIERNLRRIGKVEVPHPLIVYGNKPFDPRDSYLGYLDSLGDVPQIIYGSWMTTCWKRFIVTKELLHIYTGTDCDEEPKNADDLINAARESRLVIPDENTDLGDEAVGLFAAFEAILPWRLRDQYLWLKDNKATDWQIAKVFMIPLEVIKFLDQATCANGVKYLDLSRQLNTNNV